MTTGTPLACSTSLDTDPSMALRAALEIQHKLKVEIWPQEVYYLTGLLILAAMSLFLMNAVAGRVWCGYLYHHFWAFLA